MESMLDPNCALATHTQLFFILFFFLFIFFIALRAINPFREENREIGGDIEFAAVEKTVANLNNTNQ